jgi:phosphatidylglycerophosphatase A
MPDSEQRSLPRIVARDPVHWLASGFGAGLLPLAPGSWASALTVVLFWLLPPMNLSWHLAAGAIGFLVGVWVCGESAHRLGLKDPPAVVFDEIVGMWMTLAAVPRQAGWVAVAFFLFRALDIWKPRPIRDVDHRTPGGLGIMLDDVLAAAYAAVLVLGLRELWALLS